MHNSTTLHRSLCVRCQACRVGASSCTWLGGPSHIITLLPKCARDVSLLLTFHAMFLGYPSRVTLEIQLPDQRCFELSQAGSPHPPAHSPRSSCRCDPRNKMAVISFFIVPTKQLLGSNFSWPVKLSLMQAFNGLNAGNEVKLANIDQTSL